MNYDLDDQQLDAALGRLHKVHGLQADPTSSASAALLNRITAGASQDGQYDTLDPSVATPGSEIAAAGPAVPRAEGRVFAGAAALFMVCGIAVGIWLTGSNAPSAVSTDDLGLDDVNNSTDVSPTSTIQPSTKSEEPQQFVVFLLAASTAAELDEIGNILTSDSRDFAFYSQDDTYDEFVEYFADDPELLDTISVEAMPPSFRVDSGDSAADQQLIERLEALPQVRTVIVSTDSLAPVTPIDIEKPVATIQLVQVPPLSGLLIDDAVSRAQEAGLTVQIVTVDEPPAAPEHVIRTEPQAGTDAEVNSTLILTMQAPAIAPVSAEEAAFLALEQLISSRLELFVGYYIDDSGDVVVATSPKEAEAQIVLENSLDRTYSTTACPRSGVELAELTAEVQDEMRRMEIAGASAFGTDAKTCSVNVKAALTPAQESEINRLFGDAITVDPAFSVWRRADECTETNRTTPPDWEGAPINQSLFHVDHGLIAEVPRSNQDFYPLVCFDRTARVPVCVLLWDLSDPLAAVPSAVRRIADDETVLTFESPPDSWASAAEQFPASCFE